MLISHLRSNAIAYLALFVALGGTSAFAASQITSKQIKNNSIKSVDVGAGQVKGSDIGTGAVVGADIRDESISALDLQDGTVNGREVEDGSLSGVEIANDTLTGDDVNEASLGKVANADRLDGKGSGGFGVGVLGGSVVDPDLGQKRYSPIGVHDDLAADPSLPAPDAFKIKDFTAVAADLGGTARYTVEITVGGNAQAPVELCPASASQTCVSAATVEIPRGALWSIGIDLSADLPNENIRFAYRAIP